MAQQELKVRLSADASRFKRGMGSARGSFLNFKTAAVAGAAAVAAGIVKATEAYAEFDQKMTESQAIMGDLSENTMAAMEDAARAVARTTLVSANEAAESFFFLASAGLDAQQSMQALPKVAQFAQAGMFEMKTATDLLTDAQSALGLSMEDPMENMRQMTRLSDVLVKANTLANASVEQFSEALTNRAAAAMRSSNIELEEGVAVLAAFADQGVKARRAGMFLSRMLRILRTSAAENREEFERIGIIDAEGNMASMADTIEILTGELQGLSPTLKAARLEQLGFTARMQDAILPLLGASDQIREYEGELRRAGGTTKKVAENQLDTLSAQLNLLTDKLHDYVLELGGGVAETLALTDATRELNEALEENKEKELFAGAFPFIAGQTADQVDKFANLEAIINNLAGQVSPKLSEAFRENAQWIMRTSDNLDEAVVHISRLAARMTVASDDAVTMSEAMENLAEAGQLTREQVRGLESQMQSLRDQIPQGDLREFGQEAAAVVQDLAEGEITLEQARNTLNGLAESFGATSESADEGSESVQRIARRAREAAEAFMSLTFQTEELQQAIERGGETMDRDIDPAKITATLRQLEEIDIFEPGAMLKVQEILSDMGLEMSDLSEHTREWIETWLGVEMEAENTKDTVEDTTRSINAAIDGALQLMQAFGDVDSSVGRALGGVLQLGSAIEGLVGELDKIGTEAGASFAGIAGGIGAGLGALGSILGEVFKGPSEVELAARELAVSVELLSQNTEKLASIVDQLGEVMTEKFLTLADRFAGLDLDQSFTSAINAEEAIQEFSAELDDLGLSVLDVKNLASQMGISVDELIQVLVTGEGDIVKAGQQLEFLIKAIDELGVAAVDFTSVFEGWLEVITDVINETDGLETVLRDVAQAFRDARESSELMIDVFDIESLGKQMEILVGDLESAMGRELPDLFQRLRAADLSTRSGVEQAKELLQAIFQQGAGAFGIPQDVFREFVSSMDRLLDQAARDLESASDGATSRGGTISVGGGRTSRPDFSQRSVITEVQAEERNVLLRSQLVQEEMQTELQRAMIQVLADLPSNIRDGVDIALGEDQLVGAS